MENVGSTCHGFGGQLLTVLNRIIKEDITEVTFRQKFEDGGIHVTI